MRKLLVLVLFIPSLSFCQSFIGAKAGFSKSYLHNDYNPYSSTTRSVGYSGMNAGLVYTYNFKNFQVLIEPSYHDKGYRYPTKYFQNGVIYNSQVTHHFTWLEIPICLGWKPLNEKWFAGLTIGVVPTFLLEGKQQIHGQSETKLSGVTKVNLELTAGLKAGVHLNERKFIALNLRYGTSTGGYFRSSSSTYFYYTPFLELGYKL